MREKVELVAADHETVLRVAQLRGADRVRVGLAAVRQFATLRAAHRHHVLEVRRLSVRGPSAAADEVGRRVEHEVRDVLEHVEAEDALEARDGPVGDEERRRAQLDVDLVPGALEEAERVSGAQVRQQVRLEARPRARAEEAAERPVGAHGLVGGLVRQEGRDRAARSRITARVLEQLGDALHGPISRLAKLVPARRALAQLAPALGANLIGQ